MATTTKDLAKFGSPLHAPDRRGRDKRSAVRYELCAPVDFCWVDQKGASHHGAGRTRDISTRGAYIEGSVWPPQGALVAMNIHIPFSSDGARVLYIQTEGHVVRVESPRNEQAQGGFSIHNDRLTTYER